MPAKFSFVKVFVIYLLLQIFPFLVKGQCPIEISIQGNNLSLDYYNSGLSPDFISSIDIDLGNGLLNGNYTNLVDLETSWQTSGTNFSGLGLNGTVTINYPVDPSETCEYDVNGDLVNPLPVELSIFNGHLMETDVFLSWSTESETDNAGFQIERSFDGENYERIAFGKRSRRKR